MKLLRTGIDGLDWSLGGGIYKPSVVLVSGKAGTGKTTMSMNTAFNLARSKMKVLYISTLSEPPAMILNYMSRFDFFDQNVIDSGLLTISHVEVERRTRGNDYLKILHEVEKEKPDVIIIDPVTPLIPRGEDGRRITFNFYSMMKGWNALAMLVHELPEEELVTDDNSFLADSVLVLDTKKVRDYNRFMLSVLKSRGKKHTNSLVSYDINADGISFYPFEMLLERLKKRRKGSLKKFKVTSTGSKDLDRVLSGGLINGSSCLLLGPPGTGKKELVYHLLGNAVKRKGNATIVTTKHSPSRHIMKMEAMDQSAIKWYKKKRLSVFTVREEDVIYDLDPLIYRLSEHIRRNNTRLVMMEDIKRIGNIRSKEDGNDLIEKLGSVLHRHQTTGIYVMDGRYDLEEPHISDISSSLDYIVAISYYSDDDSRPGKCLRVVKSPVLSNKTRRMDLKMSGSGIKLTALDDRVRPEGAEKDPRKRAKDVFKP